MAERRRSLDGIRGVAIAMVFLAHHNILNAGWAGVDLFFVLSGYLITSILRRTRNDANYWQEFWIKRATRILPPFLLTIVVAGLLDRRVLHLLPWYVLSFGDVAAYFHQSLEQTASLWSLAVEEHFYLLWPFAVRSLDRRWLRTILLATIAAEPILRAIAVAKHPDWSFIYFLTPFRLDGLSLGALLAIELESSTTTALFRRLSPFGCIFSVTAYMAFYLKLRIGFTRGPTPTYNAVAYTLVALISFFLIAHLLTSTRSLVSRVLSWWPLVFLGTISYGLYLYQIMVRDYSQHVTGLSFKQVMPLSALASIAISYTSFHLYEKPLILYGKRLADKWQGRSKRQSPSVASAP